MNTEVEGLHEVKYRATLDVHSVIVTVLTTDPERYREHYDVESVRKI